jgi:hypothetical protein
MKANTNVFDENIAICEKLESMGRPEDEPCPNTECGTHCFAMHDHTLGYCTNCYFIYRPGILISIYDQVKAYNQNRKLESLTHDL